MICAAWSVVSTNCMETSNLRGLFILKPRVYAIDIKIGWGFCMFIHMHQQPYRYIALPDTVKWIGHSTRKIMFRNPHRPACYHNLHVFPAITWNNISRCLRLNYPHDPKCIYHYVVAWFATIRNTQAVRWYVLKTQYCLQCQVFIGIDEFTLTKSAAFCICCSLRSGSVPISNASAIRWFLCKFCYSASVGWCVVWQDVVLHCEHNCSLLALMTHTAWRRASIE